MCLTDVMNQSTIGVAQKFYKFYKLLKVFVSSYSSVLKLDCVIYISLCMVKKTPICFFF